MSDATVTSRQPSSSNSQHVLQDGSSNARPFTGIAAGALFIVRAGMLRILPFVDVYQSTDVDTRNRSGDLTDAARSATATLTPFEGVDCVQADSSFANLH